MLRSESDPKDLCTTDPIVRDRSASKTISYEKQVSTSLESEQRVAAAGSGRNFPYRLAPAGGIGCPRQAP